MLATGPLTKAKAERLSMIYFYAGCLLLPWLWAANVALFWKHRNRSPAIATYVTRSAIGFGVACVAFVVLTVVIRVWGTQWPIWIIRPGVEGEQQGMFSAAIYENTG
jgi:hypothetical protein